MTDPFSQFMAGGDLPASALSWLLDRFATPFLKAVGGKWEDQKERNRWDAALHSYGQSILRHYGTLRVLGKSEDVPLGEVFTDVYILDQISARRRFDIRELMERPVDRFDLPRYGSERRNGMGLINQGQSLYILGKPGAGKTTFLKNVAVAAISNRLGKPANPRLPLFVPLHEWANSKHDELLPFLVEQLDVHHFPEAEKFLTHLLEKGDGLLIFDGLDEVRQEEEQRADLARKLRNFTVKYDKCQYLITCRVAASEYVFPGLRDVEMADFTTEQILQYAQKWFGSSTQKFANFADDLKKGENAGLAELCNVPLLLSLLCLYYDDAQAFPARRAELYEDALDALLRKWDSSRQIQRDEIYKSLSHKRKQQMFAHIATPAFEKGQLYFTTQELAGEISRYLRNLPAAPPVEEIDGEAILRAIEAQHGVLVERAHNIHSFSHLTFQEYFTARYIVENEARGATARLIGDHLTDRRWREIFLLTASLLDNADGFAEKMRSTIDGLVGDGWLAQTLLWADAKMQGMDRQDVAERTAPLRLAYLFLARVLERAFVVKHRSISLIVSVSTYAFGPDHALALALERDCERARDLDFALARARDLDFDLARTRDLAGERDLDFDLDFDLARALARAFHPEVGVDYALYYGWAIAAILAKFSDWAHERTQFIGDFPQLVDFCREMGAPGVAASLARLTLPSRESDDTDWSAFAHRLWRLMEEERGFLPRRKFSQEEDNRIASYFYAVELLVRCLDLAYVTNRQEILDSLLRPPGALTTP